MNKTAIRKKQQYINDNTVESFRSLGRSIVRSLSDDVGKGMAVDLKHQLLGTTYGERNGHQEVSGDLIEGEELALSKINEKAPALHIEPGINYRRELLEGSKKITQENTRLIQRKIEEVIIEIKRLASAQKELEVEFREVAVEQRIVGPGKYHVNFFEWLLSIIRLARMKIEDSGAWLSAFQSKKSKRQYWAMFKKHGTTFGLSNERVVATQTG